MSHEEASELLGAYALDGVDGDEYADLEKHVAVCPRCQSELNSLREVAGALGNSVEQLPDGLWGSIAIRLPDAPRDTEPPPMPRLGSATRSPFRAPPSGRTRRTRTVFALLGAAAVAAIAVAVVFGVDLVHSQDNASSLQVSVAELQFKVSVLQARLNQTPAEIALQTPGRTIVTLDSSSGESLATFVITPGGHGYLVGSVLPVLAPGRTYQLWGITGGTPISLGLLGAAPIVAQFSIAGAPSASQLWLTAEPAGGSVQPTGYGSVPPTDYIVASGTV